MIRAFQWDLARQVERLDWLMAQLPRYADWGYQELYLHLEDAVDYPGLPGVARADAYSYRQFARLVGAAQKAGIGVVPIVNLLGHTQYLIKVPGLRDLNECRAPDGSPLPTGQICPLHPRTLEVAGKLMGDMAPFCTAGKIHVGLDESYNLGRHPLSRAEIARIGVEGHFARYVGRLHGLAGQFGLRLGIWADMPALMPETIPLLPPGICAYDWYYYPFRSRPAIELRNFAPYDLARALGQRGIGYWGCPMNGSFRHEPLPIFGERLANIVSWWKRCLRTRAEGMLVTSWESNRLAAEMPLAVDAAAAGLWLDGLEDPGALLEAGCRRAFGSRGGRTARALAQADKTPFSGYARWQVNERWDTLASEASLEPWREQAREVRRLARLSGPCPAARSSLRFRAYLAERDRFVREASGSVWEVRKALASGSVARGKRLLGRALADAVHFSGHIRSGRAAARLMWGRTRDRRRAGPNERILARDAARLKAWVAWLRRCGAGTDGVSARAVFRVSPVAGAWQALVEIVNFEPALQKAVIEQQGKDGRWSDLHGHFLIEFQAGAARRRSDRRIILSAPVRWEGPPSARLRIRTACRGFGRFRALSFVLTDGVRRYAASGSEQAALGRPAGRGFPSFDWARNQGTWEPRLAPVPEADDSAKPVAKLARLVQR